MPIFTETVTNRTLGKERSGMVGSDGDGAGGEAGDSSESVSGDSVESVSTIESGLEVSSTTSESESGGESSGVDREGNFEKGDDGGGDEREVEGEKQSRLLDRYLAMGFADEWEDLRNLDKGIIIELSLTETNATYF